MAEAHRLEPAGVVEAVVDGVAAARRDLPMRANLIGILSRTYGPEAAWSELAALLGHRDQLVAVDLAGDEANWPGTLFIEHINRARAAGLEITIHAGESAGPESIWQALLGLHATRIGHAVSAVQDPALLDHLASQRIGVEASLTSNVQTSTVPDYASHPARQLVEHGILVTLNTDDPGISNIDLRHEYDIAAAAAGLTAPQIRQVQGNALAVAFLTPDEKQTLVSAREAKAVHSL
jgi:adenosine deaminase